MSEVGTPAAEEAAPAAAAAENTDTGGGGKDTDKGPVPYDRFSKKVAETNAAVARADAADKKVAEIEADNKKVRDAKLEADGKIKELYDDSKTVIESQEKELDSYREQDKTRREALLSELPEESRATYEGLPLSNLETHVKSVREADNSNGGMAADSHAGNKEEPPEPKSRKGMTRKELIASNVSRRKHFFEKHGGMTVDQLRYPTRSPAK